MAGNLRGLAGEAVIYGATTMTGRLLNWLLMPFYIRIISPEEYGVVVNIYSFISILLVIFTYGMETGFFRFSREKNLPTVYKTILLSLSVSSFFLIVILSLLSKNVSYYLYDGQYFNSLILVGWIIGFDAFLSVPFANLRLNNKAIRFGIIRLTGIFTNIFFNTLFLLIIPYFIKNEILNIYLTNLYKLGNGVFYILLSNLLSSLIMFLFFIPELIKLPGKISITLLLPIFKYSWPFIIVGLTGMLIQNSDKILIPFLLIDGYKELAVYAANFKIGILMTLFTQSFRFAFEPYFFKHQNKGLDSYSKVMDYFVAFGLFIFLGVTLFTEVLNVLLTEDYLVGNPVIPVILIAQLLYGVYFNLSLWYKLTDKTYFGAIFGVVGSSVTLILNFSFIPLFGILGASYAMLIGYLIMMMGSWYFGQKYFPVPYPLLRIFIYFLSALMLFYFDSLLFINSIFFRFIFKGVTLLMFIVIFALMQKVRLSEIKKND